MTRTGLTSHWDGAGKFLKVSECRRETRDIRVRGLSSRHRQTAPTRGAVRRPDSGVAESPRDAHLSRGASRRTRRKRRLDEGDFWPRVVVEENNLDRNISTLRRVLGEKAGENRFIATVPGQGYRFVATVTTAGGERTPAITAGPAESRQTPAVALVPRATWRRFAQSLAPALPVAVVLALAATVVWSVGKRLSKRATSRSASRRARRRQTRIKRQSSAAYGCRCRSRTARAIRHCGISAMGLPKSSSTLSRA